MLFMQKELWEKRAEEIWNDKEIVKLYDYDIVGMIYELDLAIEGKKSDF